MTKLEQISVVVGEGEPRLHILLRSTRAMIKKDLPRFALGLGKVSISKCHDHCVGVGLGSREIGLVGDLFGWNRSRSITPMVLVEIRIVVIVAPAKLDITGAATSMGNIMDWSLVSGRRPRNILWHVDPFALGDLELSENLSSSSSSTL